MTGRRFRSDDRAVAVRIILAIVFILAVSFMYGVLWGPVNELKGQAEEKAAGTHYETHADTSLGFAWDGFTAIPILSLFLAALYVLVWAVIRSGPV